VTHAQTPPEVAVAKKNEFKGPYAAWSARLGNESPEQLSAFEKWLLRDRWATAGEVVKALLKRFQKPPRDRRT
jgi:hypothetical protein